MHPAFLRYRLQAPPPPPLQDYSYQPPPNQVTQLENWRLRVSHGSHGRHEWVYLATEAERAAWPLTEEDRYWLGLKTVRTPHVAFSLRCCSVC